MEVNLGRDMSSLWGAKHQSSGNNRDKLENQLLLISINFTPKTNHSCLKQWYTRFSRNPSNIKWDLTNGPRSVSCDRAIRYSGLGVRSVGPVGDFLETINNILFAKYP